MLDVEQEYVVEQLAVERADEALGEGVHVRRAHGAADDAGAGPFEGGGEASAELRVAVGDEHFGMLVRGRIAALLRAPVVGGRRGGRNVNDPAAPDVEEEEDEDRSKECVEGLHEVAAPGDVVRDEGAPPLAVAGSASRSRGHVPLHRPLRDVDPELEELATQALGAPAWVGGGHLSNDGGVAVRPRPVGCDRQRQRRRKPARCHRSTVAGCTMARAERHAAVTVARFPMSQRCQREKRIRFPRRRAFAAASCSRRSSFSAMSEACERKNAATSRSRTEIMLEATSRGHGAGSRDRRWRK